MKNLLTFCLIVCSFISYPQDTEVYRELQKRVSNQDLSQGDADFKVTDYSVSKLSKVKFIYYRQKFNGVEIVGTESNLSLTQNGKTIVNRNNFVRNLEEKVLSTNRSNTPESALATLANEMNYQFKNTIYRTYVEDNVTYLSDGGISERIIPVKEIYYAEPNGKVKVAWEISIKEINSTDWWNFILDDTTGKIIRKVNWTVECKFGDGHDHSTFNHNPESVNNHVTGSENTVAVDDNATYNVFALPIESPLYGSRTLEQAPHDITASPLGWHDTDGIDGADYTVTRGNNVNAYEDGDNFGYQPDGGPGLTFDFNFNPVYSFSDQSEDAAITNLFYWTNISHDITYRYGFDEESGNFQEFNYSGLGVAGDQVNAEAQDNSGSCNANFSSPPDGIPGTMQMYTCNTRDGSYDNHVVVHEFAHGISIRLTGGASISDCLFNDEQMGEGWSDWYGIMLTMTSADQGTDARPTGNWLFEQDINGPGIRDYPYSTDLSVDPRTYDYIKTTFGPHPLGSTWAAMLWELTWGLIDQYGFDPDFYNGTGGNNIALALVTESLKLQPCNPGFVDGRDAIILADQLLYGGQNECIIWEAFAKRGLGFSASQGSPFSRTDGVEAFDLPNTSITTPETIFCQTDPAIILGSGVPSGGVYSGPGVTDDGNGLTYTFNPAAAGVGTHTISYNAVSTCSPSGIATDTISVKDEDPIIECTDITIELDENDSASILPQDVVLGYEPGGDFSLDTNGTFNPLDISSTGTSVFLGDDQVSPFLPIGFDFGFYGNQYSNFRVSSNGFITFDDSGNSGCCFGQSLPNPSVPNNLIALGWTDLNPSSGGSITYQTIGTAPNRILIVDFTGVPLFGSSFGGVTAQVKIFENSGNIEIHSTAVSGSAMLQGVENIDGSNFIAVPGRNSQTVDISNDFVSFIPTQGGFPNNCGSETTVTLDLDTFDCNNLGDNQVTATMTDANGNSSTCIATVTVLPNDDIDFIPNETVFCEDLGIQTNLSGGVPAGGVYSGPGVTDDGNGSTFSFDPAVTGVGLVDLSYTVSNSCGSSTTIDAQFEVLPGIPQIECQDISVELEAGGTVTISPENILLGNSSSGSLYALGNNFSSTDNIYKYEYDTDNDVLTIDPSYIGSTQFSSNYALDYNKSDGMVYTLNGSGSAASRDLYNFDLTNNSSSFIASIVSVNGNTNPQAMAIGSDGSFYFAFQSGEINAFDIQTQTMSALGNVTANGGAVGLTYDYDNNRLLYTTGTSTIQLTEIDITSGTSTTLFTFSGVSGCAAQASEYIGNGKLLLSSTLGCETIYSLDLGTQTTEVILSPLGNFFNVKDLMFVDSVPVDNCNGEALTFTIDQDTFDCNDLGNNTVILTATDNQGNTSTCTATVNVVPNDDIEFTLTDNLFCEDLGIQTNIGGGLPTGGVYSGVGVTDDGNGTTFSFDPTVTGTGLFDVIYTINNACSSLSTTEQIEVIPGIPQIQCQDISVELEADGSVTIDPIDILLGNSSSGTLYALGNHFSSIDNIYKYDYDADNDNISLDSSYLGSTQFNSNIALDYNKNDGLVYGLFSESSSSPRNLYSFDLETNTSQLIETITSSTGNAKPQAMTIDDSGTFYFAFQSGEINSYDLQTQTMNPLGNVTQNGAVGLSYDNDNNRLLYTTGTSIVDLVEIDVNTGASSILFSFSGPTDCAAQSSVYVGNGKLLVSSAWSSCDKIYTLDLNTQQTQVILDPAGNFTFIKDLIFIDNVPVDNCNGEALTFTLDQDTFDCNDLGDNTVILTATDNQGNTSTCTAVVNIVPNDDIELTLTENLFCEDLGIQTNIGGGIPVGGVYSGTGVTDDGNGSSFTFDPALAGVGFTDVTYTINNACSSLSTTEQIEVIPGIPQIQCQDITVELETNGSVTILPEDVLQGDTTTANLYALGNVFSSTNNVYKFEYDSDNGNLIFDSNYIGSTQFNRSFSLDYNKNDGLVYGLFADSSSSPRNLYSFDLENNTSQFIGTIISSSGNDKPQAMAIDNNGTFYFAFQSGEINSYNLQTQVISPLGNVNAAGSVGLTYDFDNNRLLYTTNTFTMDLIEIDVNTGVSNFLFDFSSPTGCNAQAVEYVGNDKIYVSSTGGCSTIYSLEISTQQTQTIVSSTGFSNIKDLMLVNNVPTDNCSGEALTFSLDQDTFDCSDLGVNTVVVTATDSQGNTSTCTATVTVEENNSGELLDCVDSFTLALDSNGNATLDYTDLVTNPTTTGSCGDVITYSLSQDIFSCADYSNSTPTEVITNGSFENDFVNWVTTIENGTDTGNCQQGWKKLPDSSTICCCVNEVFPTDGNFGAFTSFDGTANMSYILEQTFVVPSTGNFNASLSFDWVGEFSLGGTLPRTLSVDLYDSADNIISNVYTENIPAGTASSINESLSFNVSTALELYQNQNVTLKFTAFIPEGFTGPSKAMVDNVSLLVDSSFVDVQITATSDSGATDTCNVQVFLTDPTDACGLSNTDFDFENNFSFFPNPTSGSIAVNWSNMTLRTIEIFDINGRLVLTQNVDQGFSETSIDLNKFSSGVYILKATSNFGTIARKLIKE